LGGKLGERIVDGEGLIVIRWRDATAEPDLALRSPAP
jgi:hypothetical protein